MSRQDELDSSRSNLASSILPNTARPERESYTHPSRVSYSCEACGKAYSTPHHLSAHGQHCDAHKRKLDYLLQDSKTFWEMRKKRRLGKRNSNMTLQSEVETNAARLAAQESAMPESPTENVPACDVDTTAQEPLASSSTSESAHPCSILAANVAPENVGSSSVSTDLDVPVAQRKATRERRLPKRFRDEDVLPPTSSRMPKQRPSVRQAESGTSVATSSVNSPPTQVAEPAQPGTHAMQPLVLHQSGRTAFGVVRTYSLPSGSKLTHDPEQDTTLQDLSDIPKPASKSTYGPFKSRSAFSLADWYWNSTNKSFLDFQKLLEILKGPDFSVADVVNVNWKASFRTLGANKSDLADIEDTSWITDDGWTTTPINIDIPFHKKMRADTGTISSYCVGQFRHRRIISVIKEKIMNCEDSRDFHYVPYRSTWKPTEDSPEVSLYGELYASQAFNTAHEEIQRLPFTESNRNLERVVVALMFWSDSTHLTSFGPASLWPCYMFFGNESKYRRCQPTQRLANQIAYFQKLPDTLIEYLKGRNDGKVPYDGLLAYCHREAIHQQWSILLDDQELRNAMQHGIRLTCPDGQERCFYPRLFTYSADYPEKVLLASVRNNGLSPCHRCLVSKENLAKLGAPGDVERNTPRRESEIVDLVAKARHEIVDNGYAVDSKSKVEVLLKPHSLVPTKNAFSNFSGHPFNIREALLVDQMHEFESGCWKKLFVHGIRLLEYFSTIAVTLTAELDARYRATPPFGRDAIRKFGSNASELKRKAARDMADLLQCAVPAFESLLPEPYDTQFTELLYICAEWHALAKLRLHNDFTLDFLETSTKIMGARMRHFSQEVCSKIPTKELSKEAAARAQKEGKASRKSTKKAAKLAIFTIKWHFLGDYVPTIRKYGTTDSYSTETGELAHRLPKSWYPRTDKRDYEAQMSQIERRQARLGSIRSTLPLLEKSGPSDNSMGDPTNPLSHTRSSSAENVADSNAGSGSFEVEAPLEPSPDRRYAIALNQDSPLDLAVFASTPGWDHNEDPYTKDMISKLKQHLLPRILEKLGYDGDSVPQSEYYNVVLSGDRIYKHRLLRINYTTYDVRRSEDVIHVDTPQCNIMLLNGDYGPASWDSEHAYLYGRCLGVYHANVSFVGCLPDGTRCYVDQRVDFVWVHWYEHTARDRPFTLDRLSFMSLEEPTAVGFVDPEDILRGVHIIPRFALGDADNQVRSKWISSTEKQYKEYYINRFADRDLFMRYQYGMSVGHSYMHQGNFPPPNVPKIPETFDYYDGTAAGDEETLDDDVSLDGAEEGGILGEAEDSEPGSSSLHYATHEMDEREARFYLEMYDS